MSLATESVASLRSTPTTGLAVLVFSITGAVVAGIPGAAVGLGTIVIWRVLPIVSVVAISQLGVATLLGPNPPLITFVAFEGALLAVLVGDLVDHRRTPHSFGSSLLLILGTGVIAFTATSWLDEYWLATVLVVGLIALASYGVHRYTVVQFELNNEY